MPDLPTSVLLTMLLDRLAPSVEDLGDAIAYHYGEGRRADEDVDEDVLALCTYLAAGAGAVVAVSDEDDTDRWLAAHDREVAARTLRELYGELVRWECRDTRDIGWAFPAESVLEHIDEKRAEIEHGEGGTDE